MEFDLTGIGVRMLIRFFTGLFTFGVVYGIDKLTKSNNDWDVKYILVIVSLFTTFLTILDVLGVY